MAGPSRVTQLYAEAIGKGELVRAGQAYAEALLTQRGSVRATQAYAEAVGGGALLRTTGLYGEALGHGGPDFTWAECMSFKEERFPTQIAYQSEGGPRFRTLQTEVRSGFSQRIAEWDEPLARWNVGWGIKTFEDLMLVQALFESVAGPRDGFRFKDQLDYATWQWVGQGAGVATALDMSIGTGDGATVAYQLTRTRTFGSISAVKTIYKPVAGTVLAGVNGVAVTNFSLNSTTGVLTFTPRVSATGTDISFVDAGGGQWVIRSTTTSWAGFLAGDRIRVAGSSLNDTAVPAGFYTVVSPVPAGAGDLKVAETLVAEGIGSPPLSITVDVHPAPWSGQAVTWGGEYDKPVHFVEDALDVRPEDLGAGTATVILAELRRADTL